MQPVGTPMNDDLDPLERTLSAAVQDAQTVTPAGEPLIGLLDGMRMRRARTHTDERGTLTEIFDPRWDWHPEPIVSAYYITERPGSAKGWALHKEHEDRYFIVRGEVLLVVYDVRPDSSTRGEVRELALSDRDHCIVNIPPFVWHATRTLGQTDAVLVNLPTALYDYAAPDKYRLPIDTPLIPYTFSDALGW